MPHYAITVVTPPASEPISSAEAKLNAKMQTTDEDSLVPRWIAAARSKVEQETSVRFLSQTLDIAFDAFADPWLTLPVWPITTLTSVSYYDTAGGLQVVDPANYLLDKASRPPRIGLTTAGVWPTDGRLFQPGVFRVVAGYATVADIPADLLMAVHLVFGWFAQHREPTAFEREAYDAFIGPYVPVSVM